MSGSSLARRRRRRRNGRGGGAPKRRSRGLITLSGVLILLVIVIVAAAGAGAIYAKSRYDEIASGVVPPAELIDQLSRGGARIFDRNRVLLYEFVDPLSGLRRPVPIDEISEHLIDATVATEDRDFWTNNGLNIRGLARAAYENFSPFGGQVFEGSGGSSLTQQLAKNVYILFEERAIRSIERKLKEAVIAVELTNRYT